MLKTDGFGPTAGVTFDQVGQSLRNYQCWRCNDLGAVYELSPPNQSGGNWTEQIIYSFAYYDHGTATTGTNPGGVAFVHGNLYVSTRTGGPENDYDPYDGYGNVLSLNRPHRLVASGW